MSRGEWEPGTVPLPIPPLTAPPVTASSSARCPVPLRSTPSPEDSELPPGARLHRQGMASPRTCSPRLQDTRGRPQPESSQHRSQRARRRLPPREARPPTGTLQTHERRRISRNRISTEVYLDNARLFAVQRDPSENPRLTLGKAFRLTSRDENVPCANEPVKEVGTASCQE